MVNLSLAQFSGVSRDRANTRSAWTSYQIDGDLVQSKNAASKIF